jgi:hypothetical protein
VQLNMKEDADIVTYFLLVDKKLNIIRGLGEEVDESMIIQKIIRSLHMRLDPTISSL